MPNLATDPWIPVVTTAGVETVGLHRALTDRSIRDMTLDPLEYTGVLALLVQIHATGDAPGWLRGHADDLDHRQFGQDLDLRMQSERHRWLDEQELIPQRTQRMDWASTARTLLAIQAWDPAGIRGAATDDPDTTRGKRYPVGVGWAGPGRIMLAQAATLLEAIAANTPGDVDALAPSRRRVRCDWDGDTCIGITSTYALGPDIERPGPWGLRYEGKPLAYGADRRPWEVLDRLMTGRPAHLPASGRFRIIGVDWGPQRSTVVDALEDHLDIHADVDVEAAHHLIWGVWTTLWVLARNLRAALGAADPTPTTEQLLTIREVLDQPARAILAAAAPEWGPVHAHVTREAADAGRMSARAWRGDMTPPRAELIARRELRSLVMPSTGLDAQVAAG